MVKRLVQRGRRRAVKAVAGRELVNNAQLARQLQDTIDQLSVKIIKLEQRVQEYEYTHVKYIHPDKYEEWLTDKFFQIYGKRLDFNNLETFNEKMQWLKLYGADELQTKLADKYLVKEYIEKCLGKKFVVPLLGVYDTFDEIDFDKLPEKFVIKTNNASKSNIIVTSKSEFNKDEAKREINYWLRHEQFTYGLEMHYKNIKPKIIIEKYLNFKKGVEDYKFYCFNGKAEYLLVIADRFSDEKMAFYNMEFKKQNFSILPGIKELDIKKPEQFDEMLRLTNKLAKKLNYPFVRIDWYVDQADNILFGEFTFNPGAGWYFFEPKKYDKIWGDMITLPKTRNKIP